MGNIFSEYICQCFTGKQELMLPEKYAPSDRFPSPGAISSEGLSNSDKQNYISDLEEMDTSRVLSNCYKDSVLIAFSEFAEFLSLPEASLQLITSNTQIKVMARDESSGYSLKSEWLVNFSPRQFIDYYNLLEEKTKWDKNILSIQQIEDSVIYVVFKKIGIVSQRDLLFAYAEFEHEGGLVCVTTSVEHPLFPKQKSIIRASMSFGGYYVKEIEPGISKVTALTKCDIGGSVPKSTVKSLAALNIPKMANAMKVTMKAYYENKHDS